MSIERISLVKHVLWYAAEDINDIDIKLSTSELGPGRYFYSSRSDAIETGKPKIRAYEVSVDNIHIISSNDDFTSKTPGDLVDQDYNGVALYHDDNFILCIYTKNYEHSEIPSSYWEIL